MRARLHVCVSVCRRIGAFRSRQSIKLRMCMRHSIRQIADRVSNSFSHQRILWLGKITASLRI